MLLYRLYDRRGKCEDLWCVLRKLGIRKAVFVAGTDMIRGHSDLLLSSDIVVDNKDTQQSNGEEGCKNCSVVGPKFGDGEWVDYNIMLTSRRTNATISHTQRNDL